MLLPCDFSRGELTGGAWAHYGGNGDVQMMSDKDGRLAAGWDYDAFGRTVSRVGRVGDFGHRFSTKRQEDELGVAGTGISRGVEGVYGYGLRYYSPNVGRWMSEDPIGEGGGLNVYGMLGNDAVNGVDYLGMVDWGERLDRAYGNVCLWARPVLVPVADFCEEYRLETRFFGVSQAAFGGVMVLGSGHPVLILRGCDEVMTGLYAAYSGERQKTLTVRGVEAVGIPEPVAPYVVLAGDVGLQGTMAFARNWQTVRSYEAGGNVSQVMGEGADLAANYEGIGLVHMSEYADEILTSQKLGLPSDIYAGPISNASRSGCLLTLRTGLSPSGNYGAVFIPSTGNAVFSKVVPIGPMTTWQRLTGQQYTARGIMDLKSGAFTRSGVNWNQIGIYGADSAITGGVIGSGIYFWRESR